MCQIFDVPGNLENFCELNVASQNIVDWKYQECQLTEDVMFQQIKKPTKKGHLVTVITSKYAVTESRTSVLSYSFPFSHINFLKHLLSCPCSIFRAGYITTSELHWR
jgi:hypothetical protein